MRVISGEYGGRRLEAPRGLKTRPTSDRVREALFMSFGDMTGWTVLDFFAGSGAQGIEALSRGADFAHFVDSGRPALECIAANLRTLQLEDRAKVWPFKLPSGVARLAEVVAGCDLVLADPPYGGQDARAILAALGECRFKPGVVVALERHQKDEVPSEAGALTLVRERRYGETVVNLYGARPLAPEDGSSS
ncbi:MAG: 16S rRNA (guanine(966)-N(2))-methyltransferase RsmD [Candidatus Eisenbacteria bacterium]|uniref:16S rRNA (Guanine(966)-N(2))-methyltransferase RsmD n=1 Tax=Eiseniibacteriota bacterium TaxID=2212470 RepID=A0A933SDS1_UNCEI|nr:16S rRNA (guanine(966)-N(2))-methyltransferase RsmD [Candidatus Eisenbacteria bacterium]